MNYGVIVNIIQNILSYSSFTYSTKHSPSNLILLPFFFNGWEKQLTSSKNQLTLDLKKWTIFPKSVIVCNDAGKKKKKKVSCFSTKRTLSFFLGMHILFFTLPNFFVTFCYDYILFIIIFICLSFLISFLYKFVIFFTNLFFRIIVHFFPFFFISQ